MFNFYHLLTIFANPVMFELYSRFYKTDTSNDLCEKKADRREWHYDSFVLMYIAIRFCQSNGGM